MDKKLLRMIDANFNRTKEAFRVCEDISRFYYDDKPLTKKFKALRHKITDILKASPIKYHELIINRNSHNDIGRPFDSKKHKSIEGLMLSNLQRGKESLRVLEETCKVFDRPLSIKFKNARFSLYSIEKNTIKTLHCSK